MTGFTQWRTLIDAILNDSNIQYELEVTDKSLQIKADEATTTKIQQILTDALNSPATLAKHLPYIIMEKGEITPAEISETTCKVNSPINVQEAKNIFKSLFGKKPLRDPYALDTDFIFGDQATLENGILFSTKAPAPIVPLWNMALQTFLARFHNISLDKIRRAWNGEEPLPTQNLESAIPADNQTAEGLLLSCFFKQGNRIGIDLVRLYQLIFPPALKLMATKEEVTDKWTLEIDSLHTLSYIQHCTGGKLFRIYKDSTEAENAKGQLIVLDRTPIQTKPNFYTLVLDRSSSMESQFESFKDKVKKIVQEILQNNPNAALRITWFHDAVESKEYRSLNETTLKTIFDDINTIRTSGSTRLKATIRDELKYALDNKIADTYNHVVMVCTDGEDNVKENGKLIEFSVLNTQLQQFTNEKIPLMITMGHGEHCSQELLSQLANATASVYLQLDEINNFAETLMPMVGVSTRNLKELFVELTNQQGTQEVIFAGRFSQQPGTIPQIPDITIPFRPNSTVSLTSDGNKIVVKVPDIFRVQVKNLNDQMREWSQQAHQIAANEKLTATDAKNQLEQLQKQIQQLDNLPPQQETAKKQLQQEISGYVKDFERAQQNNGFKMSAKARAQYQGALHPPTNKPSSSPASHSTPSSLNTATNKTGQLPKQNYS